MVNRPLQDAVVKRQDTQFTVDDQFRVEALREAVRARWDSEKRESTAARAAEFYKFLTSTEI